jgi:hypothetical protein
VSSGLIENIGNLKNVVETTMRALNMQNPSLFEKDYSLHRINGLSKIAENIDASIRDIKSDNAKL